MRIEYGRRRSYKQPANYQRDTAAAIGAYNKYHHSGKRRQDKLNRGKRY